MHCRCLASRRGRGVVRPQRAAGGDAWDRNIRDQIHQCQLFLPIISAHSEARDEGYFRREWALAEARTRDMSHKRSFLVPIVIDDTAERDAAVPEKFLDVQWTRLSNANADAAFVEGVKRLLATESPPSPASAPAGNPVAPTTTPRAPHRRWWVGAALAAAIAALAAAYYTYVRRGTQAPVAQAANSIAVLPLANESGDPRQQYFSDGLSENLITALTQFPGLKVIGRTSAFQFRDSKEDAHSIGTKLGVARLLEGSVQRSGDAVRVSAELIDTADGSTKWSDRYDRPYKDLFALQDDITHAVAEALRAKLLPTEHVVAQSERPPGGSLEAYNALLQGRFYVSRNTEADYRKAIEYYTQATELDPRYALAWSELARAWTFSEGFLEPAPAQKANANAREAADRAIALSPELAAAHLARGYILQVADFDWRGAEADFRRAMSYHQMRRGEVCCRESARDFGAVEPAIELTRQALVTEPLRAFWYNWLAVYLSGLNRLDQAELAIRRAIELQPGAAWYHQTLTIIEIQRSNAQAALDAARQETDRSWQNSALALAWQFAGDKKEADAGLRRLIDEDWAYQVAQVYALRGDSKSTFERLDRALSNRDAGIALLLYDSFILRFKDDPRFAAFCRKVGLPVPGEKRT